MKTIRESTEFGLDMVRGLPTAYYYSKNKIPHKCIVKPALVDMYKLVSNNVVSSKEFVPKNPPTLYQYTRPHWTRNEWEPPPLKKMFKKKIKVSFDKPTIVINNKFTLELPFRILYYLGNNKEIHYFFTFNNVFLLTRISIRNK